MPRAIHTPINPEACAEILLRAHQSVPTAGYEWTNVSCLAAGLVVIIRMNDGEQMPRDGYGWMDDEVLKGTVVVGGRNVEIYERKLGFKGLELF
jgi:hypothetical protein